MPEQDLMRKSRNFRAICRKTEKFVPESRSLFMHSRVQDATQSPHQLWKMIWSLLHPENNDTWYDGLDTDILTKKIGTFFVEKLKWIDDTIAANLTASLVLLRPSHPKPFQITISSLAPMSDADVLKLIESAPMKTLPLDVLTTSIMKLFKIELSTMIANFAIQSFAVGRYPSSMKLELATLRRKEPGLDITT